MNQLLKLTALLLFLSCNERPTAKRPTAALAPLQNDSGIVLQNGNNPYAPVDVSPMDVAYFPVDYPVAKMGKPDMAPPLARVVYSRPHKQGRAVFGTLLKYGAHWRLGANEATELELFQDATIQNKKVERGRYVLYSIPQPDRWLIVFNSNLYSWGLKQDSTHDVYRFEIPVGKTNTPIEFYTMAFQKTATGADLLMAWDDVVAKLPMVF